MRFVILSIAIVFFISCAHTQEKKQSFSEVYKKALKAAEQKDYKKAAELFEKSLQLNPPPKYEKEARIKLALMYYKSEDYEEAVSVLKDFLVLYPVDKVSVYAHYLLGMSYYNLMLSPDRDQSYTINAIKVFNEFLDRYPSSKWAEVVAKKLRECRDRYALHHIYVGKFYMKMGRYKAAGNRFRWAIEEAASESVKSKARRLLNKIGEMDESS